MTLSLALSLGMLHSLSDPTKVGINPHLMGLLGGPCPSWICPTDEDILNFPEPPFSRLAGGNPNA